MTSVASTIHFFDFTIDFLLQTDPSRHRVVAARMPGMATYNTLYPHPATGHHTIFINRFVHIMRAGRIITAIAAKQRRNITLVGADERERKRFHNLRVACSVLREIER